MNELRITPTFVFPIPYDRKRELPCKDMDLDCIPGPDGIPPFGSYVKCYLYDSEKGSCPFLPL